MGTKSEIITPSTDHWLPVYGFFSPGDPHSGKTSVNKTSIGDWDIWEASIEPITNGDPPGYRLWTIFHRPSKNVSIQGAVGRGIVAYSSKNSKLEFLFLTQDGNDPLKKARHFQFVAGKKLITRKEGQPIDLLWSIDSPYPIAIGQKVFPSAFDCLAWKVFQSDSTGGRAIPDGTLHATPWHWVSDIPGYVDKYSKYDLPDPFPFAAITGDAITFKWANELKEYPSSTGPWPEGKSIDISDARKRLNTGQWRAIVQKAAKNEFVVFGIYKK